MTVWHGEGVLSPEGCESLEADSTDPLLPLVALVAEAVHSGLCPRCGGAFPPGKYWPSALYPGVPVCDGCVVDEELGEHRAAAEWACAKEAARVAGEVRRRFVRA